MYIVSYTKYDGVGTCGFLLQDALKVGVHDKWNSFLSAVVVETQPLVFARQPDRTVVHLIAVFFLREVRKFLHAPQLQGSPDLTKALKTKVTRRPNLKERKTPCSPYCGACRIRCQPFLPGMITDIAYRLTSSARQFLSLKWGRPRNRLTHNFGASPCLCDIYLPYMHGFNQLILIGQLASSSLPTQRRTNQ